MHTKPNIFEHIALFKFPRPDARSFNVFYQIQNVSQPEAPFQLQIHHNSLHKYFKNLSSAFQLLFPFNTGAQFYVFLKRSYFATPYVWPPKKITFVITTLYSFLFRKLSIRKFNLQISFPLDLFCFRQKYLKCTFAFFYIFGCELIAGP